MPASEPMGAIPVGGLRASGGFPGEIGQDPLLLDFAHSGELLVARVRILLVSVILLAQLIPGGDPRAHRVIVPVAMAALCLALVFHAVASRGPTRWLGFVSSAVDVSLVTSALATVFLIEQPLAAIDGRTIFELYFLALGCATFRTDWRVSALAAGLAVAEYGTVVLVARSMWSPGDPGLGPLRQALIAGGVQVLHLGVLATTGVLSTLIVVRASHLRSIDTLDRASGAIRAEAFLARIEDEAGRARRYSRPLAVAVIGVDDLAGLAAREGGRAVEDVLRTVAGHLRQSVRRSDAVARTGPAELSVLLPETTAELVMGKLERVRRDVGAADILVGWRRRRTITVSLSIGVASWPDDGAHMDAVRARAAERLAAAAQAGGNRTTGPPAEPGAPAVPRPPAAPGPPGP